MGFAVLIEARHGPVTLAALRANEWELPCVDALVAVQVGLPCKALPASRAGKWLFLLVDF